MSEPTKTPKTKKIRICLAALTRVEYSEVLEVPADMTRRELEDLVERRYQDVDGGEYTDDHEYWEKGECSFEKEAANVQPSGCVIRTESGAIEVQMLEGERE